MKNLALALLALTLATPSLGGDFVLGLSKTYGKIQGENYDDYDEWQVEYAYDRNSAFKYDDLKLDGYELSFGYIWDVGKEGGFELGMKAKAAKIGSLDKQELILWIDSRTIVYEEKAVDLTGYMAMFVGEQNIGDFVKFYFAVGPGAVDGELGAASEIGFDFRLGRGPVWLGVSYYDYAWIQPGETTYDSDEVASVYGGAVNLRCRF